MACLADKIRTDGMQLTPPWKKKVSRWEALETARRDCERVAVTCHSFWTSLRPYLVSLGVLEQSPPLHDLNCVLIVAGSTLSFPLCTLVSFLYSVSGVIFWTALLFRFMLCFFWPIVFLVVCVPSPHGDQTRTTL